MANKVHRWTPEGFFSMKLTEENKSFFNQKLIENGLKILNSVFCSKKKRYYVFASSKDLRTYDIRENDWIVFEKIKGVDIISVLSDDQYKAIYSTKEPSNGSYLIKYRQESKWLCYGSGLHPSECSQELILRSGYEQAISFPSPESAIGFMNKNKLRLSDFDIYSIGYFTEKLNILKFINFPEYRRMQKRANEEHLLSENDVRISPLHQK